MDTGFPAANKAARRPPFMEKVIVSSFFFLRMQLVTETQTGPMRRAFRFCVFTSLSTSCEVYTPLSYLTSIR